MPPVGRESELISGGESQVRTEPVRTTLPSNPEQTQEQARYGSLTLDLDPADARVTLPDVKPRYQPVVRLPEGSRRVVVRRAGYREMTRSVNVSGARGFGSRWSDGSCGREHFRYLTASNSYGSPRGSSRWGRPAGKRTRTRTR